MATSSLSWLRREDPYAPWELKSRIDGGLGRARQVGGSMRAGGGGDEGEVPHIHPSARGGGGGTRGHRIALRSLPPRERFRAAVDKSDRLPLN